MPVDDRLRRPSVLLAACLWSLGTLLLLSPVLKDVALPVVKASGRTCGLTLPLAVAAPDGETTCSDKARDRAGWALLLLVLAVPPATVALLTPEGAGVATRGR